jgi:hypothetical protein
MCRIKKTWGLRQVRQAVAEANTVAEPYLPFPKRGLDGDPTWIGAVLCYGLAAETAWAKIDGGLLSSHFPTTRGG